MKKIILITTFISTAMNSYAQLDSTDRDEAVSVSKAVQAQAPPRVFPAEGVAAPVSSQKVDTLPVVGVSISKIDSIAESANKLPLFAPLFERALFAKSKRTKIAAFEHIARAINQMKVENIITASETVLYYQRTLRKQRLFPKKHERSVKVIGVTNKCLLTRLLVLKRQTTDYGEMYLIEDLLSKNFSNTPTHSAFSGQ